MDSEDNITWQEGRDPTSTVPSGEVSDGACPKRANNTHRKLTRTPAQAMPESQAKAALDSGLVWQAEKEERARAVQATGRRLSESRMRANLTSGSRWQGMETSIGCG